MKVSNNDFFNSVVKELYCPTIDLSSVTKYEIYKALLSSSTGKYNTVIRLFDASNNIVCVIYYLYNLDSSDMVLQKLENGFHNNQYNYTDTEGNPKQHSIKSIINWDYDGFTAGVSHKGSIQLTEAYKDIKHNKTISLFSKMKGNNLFHPFYNIISAKLVVKYDEQNAKDWYLKVKDRKGIERSCVVFLNEPEDEKTIFKNTEFGILEINSLPLAEEEELEVCAMFDSADGGLGMYKCANIDLSKWRPSPESGIIWYDNETSKSTKFADIVQSEGSPSTGKYRLSNYIGYWNVFEPDAQGNINLSGLITKAQLAASNKSKFNLIFMPSTLGPSGSAKIDTVGNDKIYYHFPLWVLDKFKTNEEALYKIDVTDIHDINPNGDTAKMYVINWHYTPIRQLFKQSCCKIVEAMKSTYVSGKRLIDYIDVVKVTFWGTWGEGIAYQEITEYNGNPEEGGEPNGPGPTSSDLIEISDYIINLFSGEDIFCLLPMMSYFNKTFPQAYRDYILDNPNPKTGYFFDGVGSNIAYWHQETAHYFDYTPEGMNKLCLAHKDKPIYLECSTHVSKNEMPTYQNLINFIRYFRCAYFNPTNIFFTDKDCKYNEIAMLKDISRYVGIKLGLLSFDYEYGDSDNTIKIMLRFLNCGTSKIYHGNWKLKYHLIGGGDYIVRESDFDLRNIKTAFEEDAPNWHDVTDFNPTSQTTYDNNAETVDFGRAIVKGSDKLYISIEDTTGIYDHMYLCNSEEYIQRDANGRYCLFTFKE